MKGACTAIHKQCRGGKAKEKGNESATIADRLGTLPGSVRISKRAKAKAKGSKESVMFVESLDIRPRSVLTCITKEE